MFAASIIIFCAVFGHTHQSLNGTNPFNAKRKLAIPDRVQERAKGRRLEKRTIPGMWKTHYQEGAN
jgi:hypothetical protein